MADLENTINPVMDNDEHLNSTVDTNSNFEINLGETTSEEQKNPDFSDLFSENISEDSAIGESKSLNDESLNIPTTEQNLQKAPVETPVQENIAPENSIQEVSISENLTLENNNKIDQTATDGDLNSNTDSSNNEIILGKFDNVMINSSEKEENTTTLDNSLLEHPTILEPSLTLEKNNKEEQERAKLAQKEKLAQLVKAHESKSERIGFIKGILSGIVLTAGIAIVGFIFAKDQILNLLNNNDKPQLTASIVDLTEDNNGPAEIELQYTSSDDENTLPTTENYDFELNEDTNEGMNTENNEENLLEENEELDNINYNEDEENEENEENSEEKNADNSINTNDNNEHDYIDEIPSKDIEESDTTEVNKDINEEINTEIDENANPGYNIIHVDSEEKANWVLASHCKDLTCYGEDKEFTPCSTFRLSENLDENAHRIGKNGVCKYKDPSELVYIEFN